MANPFDQFDDPDAGTTLTASAPGMANPFDAFDAPLHPVAGPSGSLLTDAGRFAATAGTNALAMPLALPNTVAQGVDWLAGKVGLHPGAQEALGSIPDPSKPSLPLFPDYPTAREMAFQTTGATEYQPQTWLGRRGMDAATAAASFPMGGGIKSIPALAGGGATGGAAAEAFPNHPLIAAMLGFVPGAAAGQMAVEAPSRLATALVGGVPNETYGAFDRLGLPTNLSGTTTGSPGLTYAEKFAARMPGSEGTMSAARNDLVSAWQDKLNQTADSLGTATTPQEAGASLQGAANDWVTNFKGLTGQMWDRFHNMVPAQTPVDVSGYKGALDNVLGNYAGAPATGSVIQPGTVKALSDALGVDLKNGNGTTLPWESVKAIRTAIGEKLESPSIISDTSQAALKQLYGGLTDDMKAGAANVSPKALQAFNDANAATKTGHDFIDDHLSGVLKATNPEQAAQYALSQARMGGSRLQALSANLGAGAMGDLGSYALRNSATNNESPTALATALTGRKPIYSPEAQSVLFPGAPTQGTIADLAKTGSAMMPVEKDLNNSPTATHAARGMGRLYAAIELAKEGHEMAGVPGALGGAALGFGAPDILGKVAQWTALNPAAARMAGTELPFQLTEPSRLARAMIAPGIANATPYPPLAPATSASSWQR